MGFSFIWSVGLRVPSYQYIAECPTLFLLNYRPMGLRLTNHFKMKNVFLSVFAFSIVFIGCSKDTPSAPVPIADFSYSGANVTAPATVQFTNNSTNSTTYSWDFGDGSISTDANPSHNYSVGGVFSVKLTATGAGGTNSVTKNVTLISAAPPSVNFSLTGDSKEANDTVTFNNSTSNATSYSWDFGDGATSTTSNPVHVYSSGGTYTVTLTATGAGGNGTKSSTVTVFNPTQLKFQVINTSGTPQVGATVTLYNNVTDYNNKTNPVLSSITDASGYFLGSRLPSVAYYYRITNGCLDNYGSSSTNRISTALTLHTLNSYNAIVINGKGSIYLTSTSTNPYEVWVDGNVQYSSMAGGSTHTINEVPLGSHTVRVLQLSGNYVFPPTDETFTVNITCGNTSNVTFP